MSKIFLIKKISGLKKFSKLGFKNSRFENFKGLVRSYEKNLFLPKDAISLCKNLQSDSV